jgi:hypothetical protein
MSKQLTPYESLGVEFLRIESPKNPQGFSPLSSASLYRSTQTSTPCAILAKSRLSTLSLTYSIISGGKVIVIDTRLRAMHIDNVQKVLNTCNVNMSNAHVQCAGDSTYDQINTKSESYRADLETIHRGRMFKLFLGGGQHTSVLPHDPRECELIRDRVQHEGTRTKDNSLSSENCGSNCRGVTA